jgi:hypothetical protein
MQGIARLPRGEDEGANYSVTSFTEVVRDGEQGRALGGGCRCASWAPTRTLPTAASPTRAALAAAAACGRSRPSAQTGLARGNPAQVHGSACKRAWACGVALKVSCPAGHWVTVAMHRGARRGWRRSPDSDSLVCRYAGPRPRESESDPGLTRIDKTTQTQIALFADPHTRNDLCGSGDRPIALMTAGLRWW